MRLVVVKCDCLLRRTIFEVRSLQTQMILCNSGINLASIGLLLNWLPSIHDFHKEIHSDSH